MKRSDTAKSFPPTSSGSGSRPILWEKKISKLFGGEVSVCVASAEMYASQVMREEAHIIASAVPKRCGEFAAGRAAARRALNALGCPPRAISRGAFGRPIWPLGYTGSISHCDGFCAAVVAHRQEFESIGFDVEIAAPLPAEVRNIVFTSREENSESLALVPDWLRGTILFSAKEAFYKCYNALTSQFLDFKDVEIILTIKTADGVSFEGSFEIIMCGKTIPRRDLSGYVGRLHIDQAFIISGVSIKSSSVIRV